jgi:hypothetical protein
MKNTILAIAAIAEAATGLIVLAIPAIAVGALFGIDIEGAAIIMSRIAGVALIGLGVACWPGRVPLVRAPVAGANQGDNIQQLCGMLTYSGLVTLYLIRIGIRGAPVGPLLWPAVIVHAVLIVLPVVAGLKARKVTST